MGRRLLSPYRKLGESIITIRRQKDISQEDLAHVSDVDRTYLSKIEQGRANPSLKVIHKVAYALKVTMDKLME